MDHAERGKFIIINNKTFQQMTGAPERTGTDVDADSLEKDFSLLSFTVERHDNLTTAQMLQLMITGNVTLCILTLSANTTVTLYDMKDL